MRVIITGATGFLGSEVVKLFNSLKVPILGIARHAHAPFLNADLSYEGPWRDKIVDFAPTHVFHIAGSVDNNNETWRTNVSATRLLVDSLNASRPWLLIAGSGAIYGDVEAADLPVVEEAPPNPTGAYAQSKLAQEQEALRYRGPLCLARLANLLGPSQSSRFVVGRLINEIAKLEAPTDSKLVIKMGNLDATRDFLDVRDAAAAIYSLALSRTTGVYNVGSGRETHLREVVKTIKGLHGGNWMVMEDTTAVPSPIQRQALAIEKIRHSTGWTPQYEIRETLKTMVTSVGD